MEKITFKSASEFIGMDYNAYLTTINKDIAQQMLSASIGNRKLNRENETALLRDMNNNDYHYDTPGSGIAFNKEGRLSNGHHTLSAFLKSNLDVITVTLFTGAGHLDKCDSGKTRTLKDSAIMTGNGEYAPIAKMAVNILRLQNGRALSNTGLKKEFAVSEILEFAKVHNDELKDIYDAIDNNKKVHKKEIITRYPKTEHSVLGAIMWELIYNEKYDSEKVKDFAFGIMSLNNHNNIIVDRFRKLVVKDSMKSNKNGAWKFEEFRLKFKTEFYKYARHCKKQG